MIHLPSPGKLNLFLHVISRRKDDYHNLQTVFQFVDFGDELIFIERDDNQIIIPNFLPSIDLHDNIIYKAAQILQKFSASSGIEICVKKNVPVGGGMGGGSSNAATTLLALNKLWKLNLPLHELIEIGAKLGSDVPIFLQGQASWAEGRGDELTPIILPEPWYVLLFPACAVETGKFFTDPQLTWTRDPLTIAGYHVGLGHNDFEPLARMYFPLIAEALDWLNAFAPARMSGTGSTVFAAFDTREEASRMVALSPSHFRALVTQGLNHSPLHAALASIEV